MGANLFDPYSEFNSDLVEIVIGCTGIHVDWPVLTEQTGYSHALRIRAYKPAINAAYEALEDQNKGIVAQIVARELWTRKISAEFRQKLIDRLNSIGWTITEDGRLGTQDALLSEQFFPSGAPHDAYVAIRDILEKATRKLFVIDPYIAKICSLR